MELRTIIVQSSSVTTSALTPLVGIGVLPVAKMLPMSHGQTFALLILEVLREKIRRRALF